MRYSKQREEVYKVLCQTDTHPDVAYVYKEVRKVIPKISLGTVYRNLEELCKAGRARKVSVEGSPERFDAKMQNHAHFVCASCGAVLDADLPKVDCSCNVGKVVRAEVMFYGVCEKCRFTQKIQKESKIMKKWVCKVCGYVHEGDEAPEVCPLCGVDSSEFEEVDD